MRRWLEALRTMVRLTPEQWRELDPIARWLVATRAAVLIMTLVSAVIAGLLAARVDRFDGVLWTLVATGLVFAHATNNLVNDVTDHMKGVDDGDYFRAQYGAQPLAHGLMTVAEMLRMIAVTGAIALACGAALVFLRGGATLVLLASGVLFVLFYTWPLKHLGLGELAVVVVWGPLMVGGGFYVITGALQWSVIAASLPFSLGATTVIFGKHIDKLAPDRAKGIRTLPVVLGERTSRAAVIAMVALQYAIVVHLVVAGVLGPALLVVALAIPSARRVVRAHLRARPEVPPPRFPARLWPLWFVAFAFDHNRRFGTAFVVGLAIDVAVQRLG